MPHAVTHVLIALIAVELFRDYFIKDKKKFPIHYVFIAGIAGLFPDIDVAVYWILYFSNFSLNEIHRTFTHNLFFPLIFLILALATIKIKSKEIGKYHMKLSMVFLMMVIGITIHLFLDAIFFGRIVLFYPFSNFSIGLNLVSNLPLPLQDIFFPSLDAAILVLWLIHEEWKHNISKFY